MKQSSLHPYHLHDVQSTFTIFYNVHTFGRQSRYLLTISVLMDSIKNGLTHNKRRVNGNLFSSSNIRWNFSIILHFYYKNVLKFRYDVSLLF